MGMGYCRCGVTEAESHKVVVPDSEAENEKWCPRCSQYLSIDCFYSNIDRYDGLSDICKLCDNKARVIRRRRGSKDGGRGVQEKG